MSRKRLTGLLFPLLAAALLAGCEAKPDAEASAPRPVKTITVQSTPTIGDSFAGIVAPRVETDLAFRTLGRLISRKVNVGDVVRKGDLVAEIDPLALRLAVTSAEADLRNAQAQLDNATITEKRKRTLAGTNAGSVADLDLAVQGLKSAEANMGQAQASLDKVREQLGYAELRAEFDGVVTATSAEVGQVVTAGQTVLRLARLDQRDVIIDVPEPQLAALHLGSRFNISLQLDKTISALGTLREVAPQADAGTRTYRIKIALEQPPEVFRLGSVVSATQVAGDAGGVILIPASAILQREGSPRVWVIDPLKHAVSSKVVRLDTASPKDSRTVRVLAGLAPGDLVAISGVNALSDGQQVRFGQEPRP